MATIPIDLLDRYAEDCEILREDLASLLEDADFQRDGGTVVYAVDHSEVYAYVFPAEAASALRLFADDDEDMIMTFQYLVTSHLFFRPANHVVLMRPYLMELQSLVYRLQQSSVLELADKIAQALDEIRSTVRDSEFAQASGWLDAIAATPSATNQIPADAERIIAFFERRAPRLVSLLEASMSEPRERLARLLSARPFEDLAQHGVGDVEPDHDTVRRWDLQLRLLREPPKRQKDQPEQDGAKSRYLDSFRFDSSYLDAVAVATVKAANERLLPGKKKIVLVTRSKFMHRLLKDEVAHGGWDASGGNILRHPRSLAPVLGRPSEGLFERLALMQKSLAVFLTSYDELRRVRTGWAGPTEDVNGVLERSLADVKSQWRLRASLSSVVTLSSGVPKQRTSHGDRSRLLRLFRSVNDSRYLRDVIRDRIARLADEFDQEHRLLGVAVLQRGRIAGGLRAVRYLEPLQKLVFELDLLKVPYTLQFFSREVSEWWEGLKQSGEVRLESLLQLMRAGFEEGKSYEPLLLVAYLFAAQDQWRLAELYADLAVEGRTRGEPEPHEGKFFLAVCKRMYEQGDPTRYEQALCLLREARKIKARSRSESDYEDPRYLKEEGTLILIWNRFSQSSPFEPLPPSAETGVRLLEDALVRIVDDDRLRIQIHNNLCYYFLQSREPELREQARRHHDQLVKLQEAATSPDKGRWPPNVVDTVLWAEWILAGEESSPKRAKQIVDELERTIARASLHDPGRGAMAKHVEAIRAALDEVSSEPSGLLAPRA